MMNIIGKYCRPLLDRDLKCRFLLLMSYLVFLLLAVLNLYIAYIVFEYFSGPGWSFMGGLFIIFAFVVTIPVLVFAGKSIRRIISGGKNRRLFAFILGFAGVLAGLVLHNATCLWIYILVFSAVLLLACMLCRPER